MERVNRPAQRIIIAVLALVLVIPLGAIGISSLMNPGDDPSAAEQQQNPADTRPTMDPADQPPRPEIAQPEPPAAMREQTSEGAQATVRYLLESYTYMMTTGDTSVWEESTDPNCSVCMSFLGNARVLHEQGGYLVDGEFTVETTSFQPAGASGEGQDAGAGEAPASGVATADFTQEASILVDDPTREATPLESVTGQIQAQMVWDGERWRVGDMSLAPAGGDAPSDGGGV